MNALAMPTTKSLPKLSLPFDVRLMRMGANALLALLGVVVLAGAGLWLARSPWLALRHIDVQGDLAHNSAASLRAQVLPQLQGNYVSLDLQAARDVFESVPWVRQAVVRRVWPDRLVVQLQEHQPLAFWERDHADDQLVDTYGTVFDVNLGDVEDEPLPTLRGPEGSAPQVLAMWQRLAPLFAQEKTMLKRLALSPGGSWQARLDTGAVIELGRGEPDEVLQRTRRFLASVGQVRAKYQFSAVEFADLRHVDGYALRLAGMGTTDSATTRSKKP